MSKHFTQSDFDGFAKSFRVNFFNSLHGFRSVCLLGTQDQAANTNLSIVSSVVHVGSHPPLFAVIFRPDSVERHSLANIMDTGMYTLNHIHPDIVQAAHQTSARYPREVSEFEATGLLPEYKGSIVAPYVSQSRVQMGLRLTERISIASNHTVLIIGKVEDVYFPSEILHEDGFLMLESAGTVTSSGLDAYHSTHRITRLSYAKPYQELTVLP